MTTGLSLVSWRVLRNKETSAAVSGLAIQPRGLREKIWTVSQPVSLATTSASCKPPLIGAWKPMRGLLFISFHDSQHIAAENLVDVAFRITAPHQLARQVRKLRNVCEVAER